MFATRVGNVVPSPQGRLGKDNEQGSHDADGTLLPLTLGTEEARAGGVSRCVKDKPPSQPMRTPRCPSAF